MSSSNLVSKLRWLLGMKAGPAASAAPAVPKQPPAAPKPPPVRTMPRLLTRQEWLVLLLLCGLPIQAREVLEEKVWEAIPWGRIRRPLSLSEYTLPGALGIRRARLAEGEISAQSAEALAQQLPREWSLGLRALQAPDKQLSRTARSTLLALQGARLGQLWEALTLYLEPPEALEVFRQAIG